MIGIGVDIEDVARFNLDRQENEGFFSLIFTPAEMEYCFLRKNPAKHLAARFCVKEAARKALSNKSVPLPAYHEVEITGNIFRKIEVTLNKDCYRNADIHVSLSCTDELAIATVSVFSMAS